MSQNEIKNCRKCQQEFTLDSNDLGFYQKMKVPNPEVCPDCRFKMRALFRNETTLYSGRKCDLCGKGIVSMYSPKSPYTVYCYDCYYGDAWSAKDYAKDYDLSRTFLEQMKELLIKVPKNCLGISSRDGNNVNSEYVNMAGGCKNCYLVFNTSPAEETLYSRGVRNGRDLCDMYFSTDAERCYESVNVQESSGVFWSKNVFASVDSAFIVNGRNLINCFGCVNLNGKSYHFLNQPLSREEYVNKVSEIMGSYKKIGEFKKEFENFLLNFPMRENNNIKNVNSYGDYLFECKNVKNSFEAARSEDCKYIFSSKVIKDSIGTIGFGTECERLLECVATGYSSNVIGSYWAENSQDVLYGFDVKNCSDCIGCDSLKHGKYSILNKKYSKEEYEKLKEIIIQELKEKDLYGLMMPPELAPFAYNESIGHDNMPLSKEEALAQGLGWQEDIQKTEGRETIQPEDIPDNIKDVVDSITNEILKCKDCSRNYKITDQELLFYRKMNIPIPRKCFYCRHHDRVVRRGPYKFWDRNCAKCNKDINTNYSPDRPEIVYCEKCYQQEVY